MRMHPAQVDIDAGLAERLVAAQFPHLAALPIRAVRSTGTVNAIYRLGDRLCARLPLVQEWAPDLEKEWRWLPELAPQLSLQVPRPVAMGRPDSSYPFAWAIYEWFDGRPYADELVDERQAAEDLAQFVLELRRINPTGAPPAGRRPLRQLVGDTREALEASRDVVDVDAALAAWERALEAPPWHGAPVWIHADLMRPNVLVRNGRIAAIIDFGAAGVGDPASDVIAAWHVFGAAGRAAFRQALDVDDSTWERARGLALHQAALGIPYYRETNPGFVAVAKRTVEQVLTDAQRG